ncbi:MAG: TolC family protein [Candidatus Didemnitutus sp.]|nr:TolC family protein [Candidatus Didemnitutus sp.]
MKLSRLLLVPAALLAAVVALSAPTTPTVVGNLTIEEAIQRALQKNFSLEIGRYNPEIAHDAIDVARGGYLPELSATASRGGIRSDQNGTSPSTRTETGDLRLGVSQRFYTGTTATVSTKVDSFETSLNPAINPAYNADVTVSVRQQLLAGADVEANRASLDRARIGFDRANLTFKSTVLDVINSTERAYYALAFAREQLDVRRFSLALAERLLDEAKTRRQTGVATDLDVLQADVGVANARRGVLLANQTVRDSEEALLALISQFELDSRLGAVSLPSTSPATPMFASSYDAAKRNQPDFLAAQILLEQLKLDLKVAKSSQKHDLSVGAAVGLDSFSSRSTSNAYNGAFGRDQTSWQVDIAYKLPWGQVSSRGRYRQAAATVHQQEVNLRSLEQNIEVQVRSAVRAVETNAESVQISSLARELSEKQYELEKARFDAGLSTSRRVLEAQNDLETARVNELSARVALRNSYSALHRIEGSSLQRYGVTLP